MTAAITNLDSGLSVAYEYHVLDRVTSIHWRDADGATLRRFGYAFDVAGNITNLLMEGQALTSRRTHYGYDMLDRLTAETTPGSTNTWSYDLADNRTNATHNGAATAYTLGIGDRLASTSDGATYLYSAAGFVTNISVPSVPSVVSLSWNSQYQLIAAYTNGVLAESYQYDALSRRISTTSGGITNYHVYDDNWQVLADLDANGRPLRSYTWAPGIDHLLAMTVYTETATNTYYALTDHLGTVHAMAGTNGVIVESYEFDAWGNVLAIRDANGNLLTSDFGHPTSAIGNRYLFQGREYAYATGLYHFRHRWYDPATGRWVSNDPIGISGGLNQYVFCVNDPVNFRDPWGMWTLQVGVSGTAGGASGVTGGFGGVFSISRESGLQVGGYATGGFGSFVGLSASLTVDVTSSPNKSIQQLSGMSLTMGGSGTIGAGPSVGGELNVPIEKYSEGSCSASHYPFPSATVSGGVGVGSPDGHVFLTRTWVGGWRLW